MYCTEHDLTLQDGIPLYWVGQLKLKKPKTLEELAPLDRELCQVLVSLGAVFNSAKLIKHDVTVPHPPLLPLSQFLLPLPRPRPLQPLLRRIKG